MAKLFEPFVFDPASVCPGPSFFRFYSRPENVEDYNTLIDVIYILDKYNRRAFKESNIQADKFLSEVSFKLRCLAFALDDAISFQSKKL